MRLALRVLTTARALERAAHGFFRPHHLSPAQFSVLSLLEPEPNGMAASDLARALVVDPSNVTGLIKRMKRRGLLEELPADDRRQHRVGLTDPGRSAWRAAHPDYERTLEAFEAAIGEAGRRAADDVLRRLEELAGAATGGPRAAEGRKPSPRPARRRPRAVIAPPPDLPMHLI